MDQIVDLESSEDDAQRSALRLAIVVMRIYMY